MRPMSMNHGLPAMPAMPSAPKMPKMAPAPSVTIQPRMPSLKQPKIQKLARGKL